jgi:hypothetical protein
MGLPNRRHHFVSDFLLKHWTGSDNKLAYFKWRPDGVLHTGRCSSRGAGYEEHLYSQSHPSGNKDAATDTANTDDLPAWPFPTAASIADTEVMQHSV